jgi:predicted nucleotidyltransferase
MPENKTDIPTFLKEDTLERLYVLNEIRSILYQNADELQQRLVVKVLAFGSVIKDSATVDSDIDICFLINIDEEESWEKTYKERKFLIGLFEGLTFPPTEIFYGQSKKPRSTHVTIEYVRTQNPENPSYIDEAMVLWETKC